MAELADALDSGRVTSVKPRLGEPLRVKMNGKIEYAGMAELADALDSGSSESNFMEVQVLLPAPNRRNSNSKLKDKGSDFFLFSGTRDSDFKNSF